MVWWGYGVGGVESWRGDVGCSNEGSGRLGWVGKGWEGYGGVRWDGCMWGGGRCGGGWVGVVGWDGVA